MKKLILMTLICFSAFAGDFISGKKAKELVKNGAILIDTRTTIEHKIKHIPGSKLIGYSEIGKAENLKKIKEWTKGKMDHPIVLYCQSGGRSAAALQSLKKAGFKNVHNLGGWARWNRD